MIKRGTEIMKTKEMISFLKTNTGDFFMMDANIAREIAARLEVQKKENDVLPEDNSRLPDKDEKWDAALYALEYFNDTSLLNKLIKENQKNANADL